MPTIDTSLFVGRCPFRDVPSSPGDLNVLRERAGLDRAVATGFNSLLYYDPVSGLERDLEDHEALSDWLYFYATLNLEFPQLEAQVQCAAQNPRTVGLRLFPTIHRTDLNSEPGLQAARLAAEHGLPLNVTARVFDGRVAPRYIQQTEVDRADLTAFLERTGETILILSMFFFNELQPLKVDWGALPNVYLDLGCSKPSVVSCEQIPSWFPVERVLYGTGAPFYYWGGSRLSLEGSRLSDGQKEAISGANAMEVFPWD